MNRRSVLRLPALVCLGLIAVGCSNASTADSSVRSDDGAIVEEGEVGAFRLQVGDCVAGAATGEVASLDGLPCEQAHELEVYHAFDVLGSDFPGADAVETEAQNGCLDAFEPFVGETYANSIYDITYLTPTAESWDRIGDREILCLIGNYDGTEKTGTAKATGV